MFPFLALSPTGTTLALAGVYLAAGVGVGALLARRGQAPATALSAMAVWPLLLPLLKETSPTDGAASPAPGPFAGRIDAALDALATLARDAGEEDLLPGGDLVGLRLALQRADDRLARVDRFVASEEASPDEHRSEGARRQLDALRAARRHAAAEIEGVLDQVTELRLQIGLVTLSGHDVDIRDQLYALRSRIGALDEVGRV
jgi:hypothetical protein